jgi:Small, acid-soluble spore proteins, alpha/beta type.
MANNNTGSNRTLVPQAKPGLDRLKFETANEIGLNNYDSVDKGNLTSRQNGSVGGFMVKKMVQNWEQDHAK